MTIWMWLIIGFLTGFVVAVIIGLLMRSGSSSDAEKDQENLAAKYAKSEVKVAVLEDKLKQAEADKAALRSQFEAECQERLDAVEADYRVKIAILQSERNNTAATSFGSTPEEIIAADQDLVTDVDDSEDMDEVGEQWAEPSPEDPTKYTEDPSLSAEIQVDETPSEQSEGIEEVAIFEQHEAAVDLKESEGLAAVPVAIDIELDEYEQEAVGSDEESDVQGGSEKESSSISKAAFAAAAAAIASSAGDKDSDMEDLGSVEISDHEGIVGENEDTFPLVRNLAEEDVVIDSEPEVTVSELTPVEVVTETAEEMAETKDRLALAEAGMAAALISDVEIGEDSDNNAPIEDDSSHSGALDELKAEKELSEMADVGFGEEESGTEAADGLEGIETALPEWPEDTSVWRGEYFNNTALEGEPIMIREDTEVNFNWGFGSPAPEINVDNFSVRWTRRAELPPGLYRFTVTSDDGVRLWVNERLIISAWYDHSEMTFRREMELPGGAVNLRLEYYENDMTALVQCSWEKIG
ncbi:MAG: PA14 domain-containing protein [Candidatus Promineifilaceae bacterium]|nr:PA14 domain-containing protein [Candidatus Promineifilaceae bacterium]